MLKLLFVEDERDVIEPVVESLRSEFDCRIEDFDKAESAIEHFMPDIVVLDILDGGSTATPETAGKGTFDQIWKLRFCPIVVYSAHPEHISEGRPEHPFVQFVRKGSTSQQELRSKIDQFRPHVEAVREAEVRVRQEFSYALRDTAPIIYRNITVEADRKNAVMRAARRRLAALMDDLSRHGEKLQAWEQYIFPPIGEDLLLGDVVRQCSGPATEAGSFFLVLSPSCDLAATGGRCAKVSEVLICSCCAIKDGLDSTMHLKNLKPSELAKKIKAGILTQGFVDGIIPLPELRGQIPTMAANLKRLKLVPFAEISDKSKYERVASIDSPFRELISWAYLQIACRPGLPDRDFDSWRDEIVARCS